MLTQVLFQVSMSVDDIVHFIIGQNKRVSISTDRFTFFKLGFFSNTFKIGIAVSAMTVTVFCSERWTWKVLYLPGSV